MLEPASGLNVLKKEVRLFACADFSWVENDKKNLDQQQGWEWLMRLEKIGKCLEIRKIRNLNRKS